MVHALKQRADVFNEYWDNYLQIEHPHILYEAARHLPFGGGKRLRPILAMLSCESISGEHEKALPFAAALELMHNFTLVHDDIMDKSTLRRNLPTVHIKYREPTAILAGDLLFAKSFEAMHDLDVPAEFFKDLQHGLVRCIIQICEGQQLDMEFEKRALISEDEYLDMITKKTAVLFRLATRGGGIIGNGTEKQIEGLTEYGLALGLSFQIWDDYLDISSDKQTLGKDIGNDIRNGKKTLIAVHSLQQAQGENKTILEQVFGNQDASDQEVHTVFSLFKDLGSVDYARDKALEFNKKAKEALQVLSDSEAKNILKNLADFSIQREK